MDQLSVFINDHAILVGSFCALLTYVLFIEFRDFTQKFEVVTPTGAISIINNSDSLLIDVREANELQDGVIANYRHIPLSSVPKEAGSLSTYKDKDILVYCRTGIRSASACRTLSKQGFEKIYNLKGGITAWKDAQLPVVKK